MAASGELYEAFFELEYVRLRRPCGVWDIATNSHARISFPIRVPHSQGSPGHKLDESHAQSFVTSSLRFSCTKRGMKRSQSLLTGCASPAF